jgi:hypothetical protein
MSEPAFGDSPHDDYPLLEQPGEDRTYGENFAFWLFDEAGRFLINSHANSVDSFWPLRRETLSVCLPGGRALVEMNEGARTTADTVGSAGVTMRCVEPFKRWRLEYAGTMRETTQAALATGPLADGEGRRVLLDWDADVTADAPLFVQGGTPESRRSMMASAAARFLGGNRYEQLFRAEVRFRIQGEPEVRFTATGTRTHRRGPRNVAGYGGHDWQSALFPNGDGFHFMRFMKPDGSLEWSEAYLLEGGKVLPAEVLTDTWLTSRDVAGERMPIRLRTENGETAIEGVVLGGIVRPMNASPGNPLIQQYGPYSRRFGFHTEPDSMLAMFQSWVRYTMDGQNANGLCERSNFSVRLER